MENLIAIAVIVILIGAATGYLYSRKKRGKACISCPYAQQCGGKNCSGNRRTPG